MNTPKQANRSHSTQIHGLQAQSRSKLSFLRDRSKCSNPKLLLTALLVLVSLEVSFDYQDLYFIPIVREPAKR
jgi:hypothetical protein